MLIIDSLVNRSILIPGSFFGNEGKYYQLVDLIMAITQTMKVENNNAYVDTEELSKALTGREIDLYDLFKSIDTLVSSYAV